MSVERVVADRGISEVVHFTTNHGCLGTLYTKNLLSRARLQDDEMVRYLFEPNAELRRDRKYLDHISLTIDHINQPFFSISADKWHRDDPIFWCILAFDPAVLAHERVVFASTNNIYTSVRRGTGEEGLLRLVRRARNPLQRQKGLALGGDAPVLSDVRTGGGPLPPFAIDGLSAAHLRADRGGAVGDGRLSEGDVPPGRRCRRRP